MLSLLMQAFPKWSLLKSCKSCCATHRGKKVGGGWGIGSRKKHNQTNRHLYYLPKWSLGQIFLMFFSASEATLTETPYYMWSLTKVWKFPKSCHAQVLLSFSNWNSCKQARFNFLSLIFLLHFYQPFKKTGSVGGYSVDLYQLYEHNWLKRKTLVYL